MFLVLLIDVENGSASNLGKFKHFLQAAVEEGIVVGGGCTLLRLASKVDAIKDSLENVEEKVCILH